MTNDCLTYIQTLFFFIFPCCKKLRPLMQFNPLSRGNRVLRHYRFHRHRRMRRADILERLLRSRTIAVVNFAQGGEGKPDIVVVVVCR